MVGVNSFFSLCRQLQKGMGDMEYVMAFQRIIMPIAYEFNPELVLVSAGFDAAIGDPLGGCKVTPEAYGHFTHWLSSLANGRIVICLEGGYNVNSISHAMAMCTKALLGDPLPPLTPPTPRINASCIETIQNVLDVQQKYWKSLRFNKKLPNFRMSPEKSPSPTDAVSIEFESMSVSSKNECVDSDTPSNDGKTTKVDDDYGTPSTSSGLQQCSSTASQSASKQTLSDYLTDNLQVGMSTV